MGSKFYRTTTTKQLREQRDTAEKVAQITASRARKLEAEVRRLKAKVAELQVKADKHDKLRAAYDEVENLLSQALSGWRVGFTTPRRVKEQIRQALSEVEAFKRG